MPNVHLTPQLESFLDGQVRAGRYASLSEAVRAAVVLLEQEAREDELKLEALRFRLDRARLEIERGEATRLANPAEVEAFVEQLAAEPEWPR